eukprot:TRINITY_DN5745_c0_g1_i1.p4 TRINITY_DN5745_c0_g1~~TRINITY_DN5745_c0_g1_i1.p4  ORF type:complete len:137 (-),score=4.62 TRINITY_DN5745_c0_g1_i1:1848-2258(-)
MQLCVLCHKYRRSQYGLLLKRCVGLLGAGNRAVLALVTVLKMGCEIERFTIGIGGTYKKAIIDNIEMEEETMMKFATAIGKDSFIKFLVMRMLLSTIIVVGDIEVVDPMYKAKAVALIIESNSSLEVLDISQIFLY